MNSTSKPASRFLPTLTEVVEVAPAARTSADLPQSAAQAGGDFSLDDTLEAVLSRLQEPLSLKIRDVVAELLQKRTLELQTLIEQEVMLQLRPWVAQAVKEAIEHQKP